MRPDWAAPANVDAWFTTRAGGVSEGPYASMNLGLHVGDDPAHVLENRRRALSGVDARPVWLNQVHGIQVADLDAGEPQGPADAAVTLRADMVCTVLVADCLPVFFCDAKGTRAGVAHAGWRGLCAGVLEATVAAMRVPPSALFAHLGPAIGPQAFEVGEDVRAAFCDKHSDAAAAFVERSEKPGKFLADLPTLARMRLRQAGVERVSGGTHCTFTDEQRFFSYRREGVTGRMGAFIRLRAPSR